VPEIVTGGVILAAITSLPNAVAAVYLARRGRGPAAFSVALNSNAVNVVVGLMIPAVLASGVSLTKDSAFITAAYLVLTIVTVGIAWVLRGIDRWAGALIIALYVGFAVVLALTG
jgi:Ca2+/Na+ antiporter